jgi:hypothetical protein
VTSSSCPLHCGERRERQHAEVWQFVKVEHRQVRRPGNAGPWLRLGEVGPLTSGDAQPQHHGHRSRRRLLHAMIIPSHTSRNSSKCHKIRFAIRVRDCSEEKTLLCLLKTDCCDSPITQRPSRSSKLLHCRAEYADVYEL